jgi:flagellin
MPIVLNTNASATEATFNLSKANESLRRTIARLSSGNRITKPTDDAAGLAVAYKLQSSVKRTEAALNNHQNALSYLQVQDGVLEAIGEIVDRMAELRTMAADVSKNAADVENYSKEFLELQDQLKQMKREKFNGVELFAVEEEWDDLKGMNKAHLKINGQEYATGQTSFGTKEEYEYFDDPIVENRTKSTYDKYEFELYTHPTGKAEDGNIKLNIVNLQFMLGLKDPNEQFGVDQNIDLDGNGTVSDTEWAASTFDRDGDGTMNGTEVADSGLDLSGDGTLTQAAGWGNTAWDTDGDGDIDNAEWTASGFDDGAGTPANANNGNRDGTEEADALSDLDAAITGSSLHDLLDPDDDDTIDQGGDKTLTTHFVDGYGNKIQVGDTLNLGGLNQTSLDSGDGSVHASNSQLLGGSGTDYADKLTNNNGDGYIKDITSVSIEEFTNIIEKIADVRAENGAEQQRVNQSLRLHQNNLVNLEAAHGRIMDVDVALESTRLARHSVKVQASAAMVAQANQMTSVALTLLQ